MRHDSILSGASLSLQPIGTEHATAEYVAWLNDPQVVAHTEVRGTANDIRSTESYITRTLDAPDAAMWRILKAGRHVGNIRLSGINKTHRRAAIAILLGDRACWGQGIGPASIELLSGHAFKELGLNKLVAGIYETNMASRRAFEKASYFHEATLRRHALVDGRYIDVWQLARFAD